MLKISKLADYANTIMNLLATQPAEIFSAAEIAKILHISGPTTSKVLKMLLEKGLVNSLRGSNGGYHLNRPASEIPLIAIIAAIDGEPALTECSEYGTTCRQNKTCVIKHNWRLINDLLVHLLQNLTLADMADSLTKHPLISQILEYQRP